ncbi:hypothetical protein, partial [Brevundimonas sp.]|uniref:hypothetical protein n=1 Tax=Brevundimonas sp. TaxID=1871086 RepID=UPI00289F8BA9
MGFILATRSARRRARVCEECDNEVVLFSRARNAAPGGSLAGQATLSVAFQPAISGARLTGLGVEDGPIASLLWPQCGRFAIGWLNDRSAYVFFSSRPSCGRKPTLNAQSIGPILYSVICAFCHKSTYLMSITKNGVDTVV